MSHSLNSLKGDYIEDHIGTIIGIIKGDTRSLDYSSNVEFSYEVLHDLEEDLVWGIEWDTSLTNIRRDQVHFLPV